MILMYHKVDIVAPTMWWVTSEAFKAQLAQLDRCQFVRLDEYDPANERHAVLTFDDAYENVYRHALPILERKGIPFEVFVIGDVIGSWNDFDPEEPLTRFAGMAHLQEMAARGGRLQWHTRSHRDLRQLTDERLEHDMTVPDELRAKFPPPHFGWLAYPFGEHDARVEDLARRRFRGAVSVRNGSAHEAWRLNRILVTEHTRLADVQRALPRSS